MIALLALALAQDDIRPIKPAVGAVASPPIWPWLAGLAVLLVVGALSVWAWRRWHTTPGRSPEELLRDRLAEAGRLRDAGEHLASADAVDAALRAFVAATTDLEALAATTEELLPALEGRLEPEVHARLVELLTACDHVRFAARPVDVAVDEAWLDALIAGLLPTPHTAETAP